MLLLSLAAAAALLVYYPMLPEVVASHFDGAGRANGWMPRESFAVLYVLLFLVMGVLFVGGTQLLGRIPDGLINLPNREYWLAPERREQSIADIGNSLLRIGQATVLFLLVVMLDTFEANLHPPVQLTLPFWPLLLLYLAVITWQTVWLLRRFRRPANA